MIPAVVFAVAFAPAQPPKPEPALPATWHGSWAGTLTITPDKGKPQEVFMGMDIRPVNDGAKYTFRITYGEGDKKQVRDYELVPKKDDPGRFEVDEKNGIRLETRLTGATLHSLFQVGDTLIQSRYERVGDVLQVEMTAYAGKDPLVTKADGTKAEVKSHRVLSVQTAALKRRDPK